MDVDDDDDEPEPPKPKKSRKEESVTAPAPSKTKPKPAPKKKVQEEEDDQEEGSDVEIPDIGDMQAYKNHKSWEDLITRVDTVERQGAGDLDVYFTLKPSLKPRHARVSNVVAKQKFPQRMLEFYEANLKWRPIPDGE
jgi:chromobox protein 5